MHRIQGENDEQRERIRRLEQEAQLNSRTYSMNLNNLKEVKDATEMILKKRIAALEARIMVWMLIFQWSIWTFSKLIHNY